MSLIQQRDSSINIPNIGDRQKRDGGHTLDNMKSISPLSVYSYIKRCHEVRNALFLLVTLIFSIDSFAAQGPTIQSVNGNPMNQITISGSGFGSSCPQCEVIVDYGKGFKYGYSTKSWSESNIKLTINDLNKGLNVQVYVKTAEGESNKIKYSVKSIILPKRKLTRPVPTGSVQDLLMFEKKSNLAVGDKGEESYSVNSQLPACGAKGTIFDHAELVTGKSRFGEAKIISSPNTACTNCSPVKVRWYHEPTGNLHYQVHVYRREVSGICTDKVRR